MRSQEPAGDRRRSCAPLVHRTADDSAGRSPGARCREAALEVSRGGRHPPPPKDRRPRRAARAKPAGRAPTRPADRATRSNSTSRSSRQPRTARRPAPFRSLGTAGSAGDQPPTGRRRSARLPAAPKALPSRLTTSGSAARRGSTGPSAIPRVRTPRPTPARPRRARAPMKASTTLSRAAGRASYGEPRGAAEDVRIRSRSGRERSRAAGRARSCGGPPASASPTVDGERGRRPPEDGTARARGGRDAPRLAAAFDREPSTRRARRTTRRPRTGKPRAAARPAAAHLPNDAQGVRAQRLRRVPRMPRS